MNFVEDYIKRLVAITEGCRDDMHEPDEQNLSMEFVEGFGFDNAFMNPPTMGADSFGCPLISDAGFWLIRDKGEPTERREWFNLACLIAIVRTGPWRN
jgi:hypothetical protein